MKIKFEEKFLNLLKERKEDNITITLKGNPSCKGFEFNPVVGIYKPDDKDINLYTPYKEEGLTVYIDKVIEKEDLENLYLHYNKLGLTENYYGDFKW